MAKKATRAGHGLAMERLADAIESLDEAQALLADQAAIDAVRQWEFTPTLLNGDPVPVVMTVTVNFLLD